MPTIAALLAGLAMTATIAPTVHATPPRMDHPVVCFIKAIGPSKAGSAANAPVAFGYTVHCNSRPEHRTIEYVLYREQQPVARGRDYSTDPAKSELFYYECASRGRATEFHTYVAMMGDHGDVDFTDDTSDSALLNC